MTSSSHFNILMMSGMSFSSVSLLIYMLRVSILLLNCITNRMILNVILRSTLNIGFSLTLIRMMNSLSIGLGYWSGFFIFRILLNIIIRVGYSCFSSNLRLRLTLVISLNILLRHSFNMILTIAFINDFCIWICLFVFFPTIINSCFYITFSHLTILRLRLNISFSSSNRLSIDITLSVSCMWLRLNISVTLLWCGLNISVTLMWCRLNISVTLMWCRLNISMRLVSMNWFSIYVGSSRISMNYMFLLLVLSSRSFFLFKSSHIRIVIVIIVINLLLRSTLNIMLIVIIKEIVLFNMSLNWSSINLNWSSIDLNRSSMNIMSNLTSIFAMSY